MMLNFDFCQAPSGKLVTRSYWIPKEGRWCTFAASNPPIAWMPWPEHPQAEGQS